MEFDDHVEKVVGLSNLMDISTEPMPGFPIFLLKIFSNDPNGNIYFQQKIFR